DRKAGSAQGLAEVAEGKGGVGLAIAHHTEGGHGIKAADVRQDREVVVQVRNTAAVAHLDPVEQAEFLQQCQEKAEHVPPFDHQQSAVVERRTRAGLGDVAAVAHRTSRSDFSTVSSMRSSKDLTTMSSPRRSRRR